MLHCAKGSLPGTDQECAEAAQCAHRSAGEEDARPDEEFSRLEQRIAQAAERREAAQKQFDRLCSICIAAQQARPLCADRKPSFCTVDLSGCSSAEALNREEIHA